MLRRVEAVYDDIIRMLEAAAFQESKSAAELVEFLQIQAGLVVEEIAAVLEHANGVFHVRLLRHSIGDLGRHTATQADDRAARRTDDDVRAYAARAISLIA